MSSVREPNVPRYVALEIYVAGDTRGNEVAMYERINWVAAKMNPPGCRHIRKFIASFQVQGSRGKYVCIVQETLGITMGRLFSYSNNNSFSIDTEILFSAPAYMFGPSSRTGRDYTYRSPA
ncbi:hypothetical protein MAP00_003079 [Monascus purpureus]|nr:hypothetical protein MAP00_003079 [Monascus purpureus]